MKQAVGLRRVGGDEPRASPWAGMTQTFGLSLGQRNSPLGRTFGLRSRSAQLSNAADVWSECDSGR
jgi:hypothetical protein